MARLKDFTLLIEKDLFAHQTLTEFEALAPKLVTQPSPTSRALLMPQRLLRIDASSAPGGPPDRDQ
jgi:hypothetical protein